MNQVAFRRARAGAVFWAATALVGGLVAIPATASAGGPVVHVSAKTAKAGELVQVSGSGWFPVGETVQIELCGQNALNISDDCDQVDQYTAAIRSGGVFYGAVVTRIPPAPCPCVILVRNQGSFSGARTPITVVGARTAPLPPGAAPSDPVAITAKVLTPVSVAGWFGGPNRVTLVLRVRNLSPFAYDSANLSVNVGRGRHPNGFVLARQMAPLAVGGTQVLRIPVTLPAFTFGAYSVQAQVITGQGQVSTLVGTSSYPWGIFVIAALVLQAILLVLRNRLRARLGRRVEAEPPALVPEQVASPEPVEILDIRTPVLQPAETETPAAPEPVEVADVRVPSVPADATDPAAEPVEVTEPLAPSATVDAVDPAQPPVDAADLRATPWPVEVSGFGPHRTEGAPEILDLRAPTLASGDVWTTTQRVAIPLPGRRVTCTIEVLACPAIRLQRTTVRAWDDFAVSPWDALHDDRLWADMATRSASNSPLPGETFRYDARGLKLELHVSAASAELTMGESRTVQPVRIRGSAALGDQSWPVDVESTLEQVWVTEASGHPRVTDSGPPAGPLTYAQSNAGDAFYLHFGADGRPVGWLVRGGRSSTIVRADRSVEERMGPYPRRLTVDLTDDLGRRVVALGTAFNGMAVQEDDGLVLESRLEWSIYGEPALGEDRSLLDVATWRTTVRAQAFESGAGGAASDAATPRSQVEAVDISDSAQRQEAATADS